MFKRFIFIGCEQEKQPRFLASAIVAYYILTEGPGVARGKKLEELKKNKNISNKTSPGHP